MKLSNLGLQQFSLFISYILYFLLIVNVSTLVEVCESGSFFGSEKYLRASYDYMVDFVCTVLEI